MIDSNCAGCTSQDKNQALTKEFSSQQPLKARQKSKQHRVSSNAPSNSPLASPLLPSNVRSSTALATAFNLSPPARLSSPGHTTYPLSEHHLLPSLSPLNLLTTSAEIPHFALTPDARACVTATYLCVLIVNNTWLDCNLLEMLCNGSGYSSSAEEKKHKRQERRYAGKLSDPAFLATKSSLDRGALESVLNELIVFAGGGGDRISYREDESTDEDEEGQPKGAESSKVYDDRSIRDEYLQDNQHIWSADADKLKSLQQSVQFPFELHKSQVGLPEKGGGNKKGFSLPLFRRLITQPSALDEEGELEDEAEESEEKQLTQRERPPVTRQSRGWGSYAFWAGTSEATTSGPGQQVEQHEGTNNKLQQSIQILRPVDKVEQQQFNDISTNQSSSLKIGLLGGSIIYKPLIVMSGTSSLYPSNNNKNKQSQQTSLLALQHRHQHQHHQQAAPATTSSMTFKNLPYSLHETSSTPAEGSSVMMLEHADSDNDEREGEIGGSDAQQAHFSAPSASSSFADSSESSLNSGNSNQQHRLFQNQIITSSGQQQQQQHPKDQHFQQLRFPHLHPQQLFMQQHQSSRNDDCKCISQSETDLISDDLSAPEVLEQPYCRPPYPSRCSAGSSKGQLMSSTSFAISQQVAAAAAGSTTVIPSITSAKMSPLDVSFILYSRLSSKQQQAGGLQVLEASRSSSNNPADIESVENESSSPADSSSASLFGSNEIILSENGSGLEYLNTSLPIKIVIHGFGSGGRRSWVSDMVYKLLDYENVNVIVVDWEKGAALPNYVQAAGNTRLVGHKIANLIKKINAEYGLTGSSYHLIGFSLGAHVAGFAGMELRNYSSNGLSRPLLLNRITGLDPASPLFEGYEVNDRLDPSDAQFVDVIHSNGDGVLRGGFGSLQPMGHVDFYPNGGRVQVGCNSVLLSALSDIIHGKWQSLCNHRRALNFFMDSFEFSKCRFQAFNCDSYENYLRGDCFDCGFNNEKCSYMGYLANYSKGRGKMYLTTHEEAPFCANQFTIQIFGSKGFKSHWGKVEVTLVSNNGAKNESFWLSPSNLQQPNTNSGSSGGSSSSSSSTTSSNPSSSLNSGKVIENSGVAGSGSNSIGGVSSSASSTISSGSSLTGSGNDLVVSVGSSGTGGTIRDPSSQQQTSMRSLIVAHPSLANLTQVLLRYTKYKGWIYSGEESWSIDKVLLTDSEGQMRSYCGSNTILESYVTSRLTLEPGNCTVAESTSTGGSFSTSLSVGSRASLGSSSSVVPGLEAGARPGTPSTGSGLTAAGSHQQQQQQQLQPASHTQQHSSRSTRLFAALQNGAEQSSITPSSPLSHALQRLTAGLDRPAVQMKFVYVPQFVVF